MKVKKRLFAGMLALAMLLSLNVTALASAPGSGDGTEPIYTDADSVTITKVYKATNDGTSSPEETFTLKQISNGVVADGDAASAPDLGDITGAYFAAGAATTTGVTAKITVNLPTYERVGVYEYTLQEVDGKTAGVDYYSDTIKLVVTVMQGADGKIRVAGVHTETAGGEKSDTFTNTYSAGTLSVSKTVTGNMGDHDKYFEFTVTLTGEDGKTYADSYAVSGGSNSSNPKSIVIGEATTFYLKDGDTISIANLPYGVTYTVTEVDANEDDYTTTSTGANGAINAGTQTAAFTNDKTGEVDTGVYLDNLPYIIVFAGVLAAVAVLVIRRRRVDD